MFDNRQHAGQLLAQQLVDYKTPQSIVIALPRGGVPVGFEISRILSLSLDVVVVRKLGAPKFPELGFGAIAPEGIKVLDSEIIEKLNISPTDQLLIEDRERVELIRRQNKYRSSQSPLQLNNLDVILVDDGLATGITMRAAVEYVSQFKPHRLVIAVPICASQSEKLFGSEEIICLHTSPRMSSVGEWYRDFSQVEDNQVVHYLEESVKWNS